MICPLCDEAVYIVSPYWYNRKIVECCCVCAKEKNLQMINMWKDSQGVGRWKVHIEAKWK